MKQKVPPVWRPRHIIIIFNNYLQFGLETSESRQTGMTYFSLDRDEPYIIVPNTLTQCPFRLSHVVSFS